MIPVLTVSIVSHNSWDVLEGCLDSLEADRSSSFLEIVVVDNASSDDTVEAVRKRGIRVIALKSNGYFPSNNAALKEARGEFFVTLNPDIVPEPGALRALVAAMKSDPAVAAVVPKHMLPDGTVEFVARRRVMPSDSFWAHSFIQALAPAKARDVYHSLTEPTRCAGLDPREAEVLQDSCLLTRTAYMRRIGGYDTRFRLYFTDDDISIRLASFGRVLYLPSVTVRHLRSTSVRKKHPVWIKWIWFRDLLHYHRRHNGIIAALGLFPLMGASLVAYGAAWYASRLAGSQRYGLRG